MNKLKVVVYAITKNEEKFVKRWFDSMSEADEIVVLDTGSTDKTVEKLRNLGVKVDVKSIYPWRFDNARNESLSLVPTDADVCVCTDLDEVFDKGWRKNIENVWIKNKTTQLKYIYVWNTLPNGKEGVTFLYEKIHARNNFKWIYPVHEILINTNKNLQTKSDIDNIDTNDNLNSTSLNEKYENVIVNKNIVLRHFPDQNKSRGQYLQLLELSVKEQPESDRNTHYLAREYYFNKKFFKAINMFKRHLKMKNATWTEERSASYNYIGDCYLGVYDLLKIKIKNLKEKINLKNKNLNFNKKIEKHKEKIEKLSKKQKKYLLLAEKNYKKAILENANTRESYYNLANFYYFIKKDYLNCIFTINSMLVINEKTLSYMTNPNCWNEYPFDLLSMSYYKVKNYLLALVNCQKAVQINPLDERIKNNLNFFNKYLLNYQNKTFF